MNKTEQLSLAVQSLNVDQSDKMREHIRSVINDLIENDFSQLVQFLYQVDVSENKLKQLLHEHPQTDAAVLITNLLIERQVEKLKTKASFRKDDRVDEEEKW